MVLDNTADCKQLEVTMGKIDNVLSDSYEDLNSGVRSTLSGQPSCWRTSQRHCRRPRTSRPMSR